MTPEIHKNFLEQPPVNTACFKKVSLSLLIAIAIQMLSASDVNELKALSSKYTRTEMVWIYRNLLSAPQREQIVAVAAAQQLTLFGE